MRRVRDGQASTGDATEARSRGSATATESAGESLPRRQPLPVTRVKVGERLARLFEDSRRPDGQLWTITYLTDELKARGHEVSRQYLGHLLTGERDNPTLSLLEVLADVFKVPVSYFSDDYLGRVTNDLLPLLAAVQDPNVRALLHRSDLPDVAAVLANTEQIAATPQLTELLTRPDLQDVAEDLTHRELLAWLGDRPLADVLATLRTPVVQSAVEETLANWLKYGTGR